MIVKATSKDVEAIASLALKLWPEHDIDELVEEFQQLLCKNDACIFLAKSDDQTVGFAQCQLRFDYVEGTQTSPVGYLEGIFVEQNFRGKGISKQLLSNCQSWAKENGCSEFASDCELSNTASQAFHKSAGFVEANRIVCYVKKL